MTTLVRTGEVVALALTAVPSGLLVGGIIDGATNRTLMAVGAVLWFAIQIAHLRRSKG